MLDNRKHIKLIFEKLYNVDEYRKKIEGLKYLSNKNDFLDRENSFPISYSLYILLDKIEQAKYRYRIDKYGHLMCVQMPWGNKIIVQGDYGFNDSVIRKIFNDKNYTNQILTHNGYNVPREFLLMMKNNSYCDYSDNYEEHILGQVANLGGFPIIAKPIDGRRGRGVEKIFDEDGLFTFLDYINNMKRDGEKYILQEYVRGIDHRILYLDGEVLVSYQRHILSIVGDGVSNIAGLIEQMNLDEEILGLINKFFRSKKTDTTDVLELGQIFQILPTANISTGGRANVIQLDEEDILFVKKIAKTFGSNYFGLDVITEKKVCQGKIIEINLTPGINGIAKTLPGFEERFVDIVWNRISS